MFLIQLFQSIKQGKWTPRKKKSGKLEKGVYKTIGLGAYFQANRQGEGVQVGGTVQACRACRATKTKDSLYVNQIMLEYIHLWVE